MSEAWRASFTPLASSLIDVCNESRTPRDSSVTASRTPVAPSSTDFATRRTYGRKSLSRASRKERLVGAMTIEPMRAAPASTDIARGVGDDGRDAHLCSYVVPGPGPKPSRVEPSGTVLRPDFRGGGGGGRILRSSAV